MSSETIPKFSSLSYETSHDGRVARILLNRPERGNGITQYMTREVLHFVSILFLIRMFLVYIVRLEDMIVVMIFGQRFGFVQLLEAIEVANLDPHIHVIGLEGAGKGFCGGYDLYVTAEKGFQGGEFNGVDEIQQRTEKRENDIELDVDPRKKESVLSTTSIAANHDANRTWDPTLDFQLMSRNVRGFMSLFRSEKPIVCKVHGFCVAGGTDMALCSDILLIEDDARIGYSPARVWGVPTTAMWMERVGVQRAKRLLLTGDLISGTEAAMCGLALASYPKDRLDIEFEDLLNRISLVPVNQLILHKQLCNAWLLQQGLESVQLLATYFDGIARHTEEGYGFQQQAQRDGFRDAISRRDAPFHDRPFQNSEQFGMVSVPPRARL